VALALGGNEGDAKQRKKSLECSVKFSAKMVNRSSRDALKGDFGYRSSAANSDRPGSPIETTG
jgi:hypothetical protein